MKRHYRIVSLPQAVALLQRGEIDVPTVVLSLDDGYAENLTGLRAVAECEGVPVTICVCTRHVSDRSELAHDLTRSERGFASMGWTDVRYLDRHGVTIASHTRTHFNCGSGDYAFRGRKSIEPGEGQAAAVETKYRCKACSHEWKVRAPESG